MNIEWVDKIVLDALKYTADIAGREVNETTKLMHTFDSTDFMVLNDVLYSKLRISLGDIGGIKPGDTPKTLSHRYSIKVMNMAEFRKS